MAILVNGVLKSIRLRKAAVSRELTGCTLTVVEGLPNHLAQPNLVCGSSIPRSNCQTHFGIFFCKSVMVKMRENAPVDAHFYALFHFGRDLSDLNGLLDMQNPDTSVRELPQDFREVGRFKIAFSAQFYGSERDATFRKIDGK